MRVRHHGIAKSRTLAGQTHLLLDLHKEISNPQASIWSPCTAVRLPLSAEFLFPDSNARCSGVLVLLNVIATAET